MKKTNALDITTGTPTAFGSGVAKLFPGGNPRSRIRKRDLLPLREAIPLWFAVSSPLIGLVIGFLGAWFVTWLTR